MVVVAMPSKETEVEVDCDRCFDQGSAFRVGFAEVPELNQIRCRRCPGPHIAGPVFGGDCGREFQRLRSRLGSDGTPYCSPGDRRASSSASSSAGRWRFLAVRIASEISPYLPVR